MDDAINIVNDNEVIVKGYCCIHRNVPKYVAQDQLNFLVTRPLLIIFPPCSIPYHNRLHLLCKSQKCYTVFMSHAIPYCGLGSVVGIAIGYGLDGLGIESRWGRNFPHLSRPSLGPTQPPVQWVLCLSRGLRAAVA